MTIPANAPLSSGPYLGNGVTTVFDFEFGVFAETELQVVLLDALGVETNRVLGTHYTVSPTGGTYPAADGTITMLVPPAVGEELIILPDITRSQDRPYGSQSSISLQEIEDALDKLTSITRQLYERALRAVTVSAFNPGDIDQLLANINAIIALEADIAAITANLADIQAVAANAANIDLVAGSIANVNIAAAAIAAINTVAASIASVNTVAGAIAAVNTVAAAVTNLNTVATNIASVNTVATNIANVNTAVTNIAAINTVATNIAAIIDVSQLIPSGAVIHVAMNTPPLGYVKANGQAISRSAFAALFAAIGTTFGAGDGSTTFNVPDLRGEFVRAWDDGRGVDSGRDFGSAQGGQVQNHTHSGTTASNGAHTHTGSAASAGAHTHSITDPGHSHAGSLFRPGASFTLSTTGGTLHAQGNTDGATTGISIQSGGAHTHTLSVNSNGDHTHTVTTGNPNTGGGTDTRPRNVALLACIKL